MNHISVHVDHLDFEQSPVGLGRQLRRCAGIADVQTDRASCATTVVFDPLFCDTPAVLHMIEECGYRCCLQLAP